MRASTPLESNRQSSREEACAAGVDRRGLAANTGVAGDEVAGDEMAVEN